MRSVILSFLLFITTTQLILAQSQLTPDNLFGTGGAVTIDIDSVYDNIRSILVQDDGQILVAGQLQGNPYPDSIVVVRLNTDGTLDNTFGINGVASASTPDPLMAEVHDMAIQTDGQILTCGTGMEQGSQPCFSMIRFNENGTVDSAFGEHGIVTTEFTDKWAKATSIHVYDNGAVLLGGNAHPETSDLADFALAKYHQNGIIDSSFGNNGTVLTDFGLYRNDQLTATWVFEDGRILAAGHSSGKVGMAKYLSNGTLDTSFGDSGLVVFSDLLNNGIFVSDVEVIDNGNILIGGTTNVGGSSVFTLFKFHSNGSIDTSYGMSGVERLGWTGTHNLTDLQVFNSEIYAGGIYNDITDRYFLLAKLNSDGTYNTSFGTDGLAIGVHGGANAIAFQPNGKLLSLGIVPGYLYFDALVARYDIPTTGVIDLNRVKDFEVYPNPTTSTITLQTETPLSQAWLTELTGRRLMPLQPNGTQWQADLSQLPSGMYLIDVLTQEGRRGVKKVVRE